MQACLVAFVYLEWYRAEQLRRGDLTEPERRWWGGQRSHGLSLAVSQQVEDHVLTQVYRWSATTSGRRKLRRALKESLPREYRPAG